MDRIDNEYYLEYKELVPEFVSESNYRNFVNRSKIDKIGTGGNGRKVLIRISSLPEAIQNEIGAKLGDLDELYSLTYFQNLLQPDFRALKWIRDNKERFTDSEADTYYQHIQWMNMCVSLQKDAKTRFGSKREFWRLFLNAVKHYKVGLPTNYAYFQNKLGEYNKAGYEAIVKNYTGNTNSQKMSETMGAWAIARYADRVKRVDFEALLLEYNVEAERQGEKPLKSSQTLRNFLNKPENKRLWYGFRYGHLAAKEKFAYKIRTKLPSYRDALWYSDGTKLNYFDKAGKLKASYTVYEIIDAYSECFLGYAIGTSENFEVQFRAARMALEFSGHKPYEWKYDNQGGHKKLQNEDLLNKLAKVSATTRPYNGSSKTIESIFGRFQQKYMSKDWFFTGQNITATKQESKANMEFVLANMTNLPTIEEITKIYEQRRMEWNNAPHHRTGIARIEMYSTSQNPEPIPVDKWDMIDLFWLTRQATYYNTGINIEVSKQDYHFEVLDAEGMPDVDFRRKYVGETVYVKYDPQAMSEVLIYIKASNGLRYVATAVETLEAHRALQEHEEGEAKLIKQLVELSKAEQRDMYNSGLEVLKQHDRDAESYGLNSPVIPGLMTGKNRTKKDSPAKLLKEQSYADQEVESVTEWWKQL